MLHTLSTLMVNAHLSWVGINPLVLVVPLNHYHSSSVLISRSTNNCQWALRRFSYCHGVTLNSSVYVTLK